MQFQQQPSGMGQQEAIRSVAENAARELAAMVRRGEITDVEQYLNDPEFMMSLFEMPVRAAVKLAEERLARKEAEAALS